MVVCCIPITLAISIRKSIRAEPERDAGAIRPAWSNWCRRIAIAGLGQSARTIHLPAYKRIPALEIVGGCDPKASPGQFAFPLFPSIPEMLNATKPHILAVVTPPDSHFYIAKLGLESDCHVFCEKPFMNNLAICGLGWQ